METFELILMLSAAVLLSSVLEQLIPRVSLPLIQIAMGVVIALLAVNPIQISLDPQFFLLVFIAPLLFNDAKEADKLGLWKNRRLILSLAIGLVICITLVVGFSLNLLIPSIPLTAAFALGAALGPTDAVAVSSLAGEAQLARHERALLSGESLLNDAAGVVSFQFAIAAAVTGSFSLANASISFIISFIGGIVLGLALGWLAHFIQMRVNELGLDSNTFHVLFDVTLPFIIYLASELLGVSGILAVVAAGLLLSTYTDRLIGPAASRLSIVSTSVWRVLAFTLNGIVFVMLGLQLPNAMKSTWGDVAIGNWVIIAYVAAITAVIVLVRFLWLFILDHLRTDPVTGKKRSQSPGFVRSTCIATIGGPKGAVTLSVIFSTPLFLNDGTAFPQRELLIFIASGVILLTMLLANFLLPVLAPIDDSEGEDQEALARTKVDIMRAVIDRLAESRTKTNATATGAVIKSYNDRIERIQDQADIESESSVKLRIELIHLQQDYIIELMEAGRIDDVEGYEYLRKLSKTKNYLKHKNDNWWLYVNAVRHSNTTMRVLRRSLRKLFADLSTGDERSNALEIQIMAERKVIEHLHGYLDSNDDTYPSEVVAQVLLQFQTTLRSLENSRPSVTVYTRTTDRMDAVERFAYNVELEEIQRAQDNGDLNRMEAKEMRDNVYLMLVDLDALS